MTEIKPGANILWKGGGNFTALVNNIGSAISTLNSSQSVTMANKLYFSNDGKLQVNISALSGQVLLGQAFGISADNQ